MKLEFLPNGCLKPKIYNLTLAQLEIEYGYNEVQKKQIDGLKLGIEYLIDCGCEDIYIDGSFITKKEVPNDFDACWSLKNVDLEKLKTKYPVFFDFEDGRKNQKLKFHGEFFPADVIAQPPSKIYLDFFQEDRDGNPKGIIKININD